MDFSPPPKLWVPSKPAIVRAAWLPRTPAEVAGLKFTPPVLGLGAGAAAAVAATPAEEAGITSIAVQGSNTSNGSASVTCPACAAGDILVLAQYARSSFAGGAPSEVNPSGFVTIGSDDLYNDPNGARAVLSYKLAAGTEGGTSLTGMNGNSRNAKAIYVFRPDVAAASLTVGSFAGTMTDGNPSALNVTAGSATPPLVVVGMYACEGTINPRTFSTTKDGEINANGDGVNLYLAYKIYTSSPANTSIDMDDEGTFNCVHGAWITPNL